MRRQRLFVIKKYSEKAETKEFTNYKEENEFFWNLGLIKFLETERKPIQLE